MKIQPRSLALRYGIALLSVTVAFFVTLVVPWLRERESFILFFGAVSLNAWYGGRGPALLCCVLTAFLHDYFIFYPPFEFSLGKEEIVPLGVFLLVAIMISSMTTALARAEERAREQQQWLQVTLSSIGDAVIATDAHGRVMFINTVAQTLTDWTPSEARDQPIERVFELAADAVSPAVSPVERVIKENLTVNLPSGLGLTSLAGRRSLIEGNAAPIKSAHGQVIGAVLVFRDVKEREEARSKILEYQQRLRSMASEVSLAEERERREIANGLHDRIGQSLALSRIKLGSLRARMTESELVSEVDEITQVLKQIIGEVRSLTFELSPPVLYEFGLEAGLEWLAGSVQKQHGLECVFKRAGISAPLKQETSVMLFQAVRELLTNVVKHAHAQRAAVSVVKEAQQVSIAVEDDGAGFDPSAAMLASEKARCFGLFNIRERISYLGGTFVIKSQPGQGTRVALTLPVL